MSRTTLLCVIAAVIGVAALVVVFLMWPLALTPGYLSALVFTASIPIGATTMLLTHRLTGGRWGFRIAVPGIAAASVFWLFPIAALPMLLGLGAYGWHNPGAAEIDIIVHRAPWMSTPLVLARAVAFAALAMLVVTAVGRWRERPTEHGGPAALGLILLLLGVTFLSVDWILALDTEPSSSIFGLTIFFGCVTNAMALLVLCAVADGLDPDESGRLIIGDLGALLLAAVCFDFYVQFSQFFIIWNGNLPHGVLWYRPRMEGPWLGLTIAQAICRYAVPIPMLISHRLKRRAYPLAAVAALVLFSGVLNAAWEVLPSSSASGAGLVAASVGSMLVLGGAGALIFVRQRGVLRPGTTGVTP